MPIEAWAEGRRPPRIQGPVALGGGAFFGVHPAFPGKDVPVRKKAPTSRKSDAIATHAASGVNGDGTHGTHRYPPDNPLGSGGEQDRRWVGQGSVRSVAHPGSRCGRRCP